MSNTKSNGKVAFITGGNRGLGLETARELGRQGIVVVIGSRDSKKGEAAAAELRDEGISVLKEGQISATGSGPNPVTAVSPEMLRETFETNFFASVALTQKLLPLIGKSPAGRIVNVSSILGSLTLHSDPNSPIYPFKTFAYDASKAALNAFTIHLASELRDNKIKVNSAHPGWVKTEMGGPNATMEVSEGGKTSAQLATLADDGPNGGFFHLGQPLPW